VQRTPRKITQPLPSRGDAVVGRQLKRDRVENLTQNGVDGGNADTVLAEGVGGFC
jgi:hypothetical protein